MPIFYIALFVWPFLAPNIWSLIIVQFILVVIVHSDQQEYTREPSFIGWLIGGFIPFLIVFAILLGIYPINKPLIETKTVIVEKIPIVSLSNSNEVSGSFVLGSGSVNTSPSYISKRVTGDGGFETFMVTGKTIVYEDRADASKAVVISYEKQARENRSNLPNWVRYLIREDAVGPWKAREQYNHIHVPKGTVTKVMQI